MLQLNNTEFFTNKSKQFIINYRIKNCFLLLHLFHTVSQYILHGTLCFKYFRLVHSFSAQRLKFTISFSLKAVPNIRNIHILIQSRLTIQETTDILLC